MAEKSNFMDKLKRLDPEFHEVMSAVSAKSQQPGTLDPKTIILSLALDAAGSHPDGVRNIASRARAMGVKDQEIIETIRLAFMVAGIPGLVAGLAAFPD
jgi:alkylhydroperoxidase/carboxymuconolactone decarboxylase family protein YurZ